MYVIKIKMTEKRVSLILICRASFLAMHKQIVLISIFSILKVPGKSLVSNGPKFGAPVNLI